MSHKKSISIIFAIIFQIIAVGIILSSFFLPIYQFKVSNTTDQSEVQLLYREYKCKYTTDNTTSTLNKSITNSYSDKPDGIECLPFFFQDQDLSKIGYYMKLSLAALAIGFTGTLITLLFTMIMSCHNKCRTCGMKIFAFIFSAVPFVLYLLSPLVLLAITNSLYKSYSSDNSQNESSSSSPINLCTDKWCSEFYGSKVIDGNTYKWGPTYGWSCGILASFFALISTILTACSSRYKQHYHDNDYRYSLLVNKF